MANLISDKDIENLEKIKQVLSEVKQILKQIRGMDNNFSLSNVIEADEDTILIFNCDFLLKKESIEEIQKELTNKLQHKCIVLNCNIKLDKAIGVDYAKGKDYTTVTYYDDEGNPIKEETTQYK